MSNSSNSENKKKSNNAVRVILMIIAILMIIFGAVYFGYYLFDQQNAGNGEEQLSSFVSSTKKEEEHFAKNPIDFDSLQKQNDEIYAWIKVPDTKVDYPICQSKTDDSFYLRHDALDKSYVSSGAIYTEFSNTKTFEDRVTVIYGHNGYSNASMFTTLHQFEDGAFFNDHPYFYIYTPKSILTYQVISAFKFDNRHIMNSYNFPENNVFMEFIDMIQNPTSAKKNVRNTLDKEITIDDNIVVLSTCITNQKSSRYLVCGVLVKNEKTN